MSERPGDGNPTTQVTRIALQRVDLVAHVMTDPALQGSDLFQELGDDQAKILLQAGAGVRFADGAVVFREQEPGDSVFFILKGEAKLSGDGQELGIAPKGGLFGEAEWVAKSKLRSCTAVAVGDLQVIELPVLAVEQMAKIRPRLPPLLQQVAAKRQTAASELDDFLNRW